MSTYMRCMLGTALWVAAAGASAQQHVKEALQQALPRGWECLQGPNELDVPGRTFYIDRKGVRYELADLNAQLTPAAGDMSSVTTGSSGRISAGLLARLLKLTGSFSISGSRTYETSILLKQRQELRTDEADIRAALRTLSPTLLESGNTYYIIRNVQLAKEVRVTVDRSIAGAFGGEAPFKKLFQVSGAAPPALSPPASELPQPKADASQAAPVAAPAAAGQGEGAGAMPKTFTADVAGKIVATVGKKPDISGRVGVEYGQASASSVPTPIESAEEKTSASQAAPAIISGESERTFEIDQTYEKPLTVCFLAQKFTLKSVTGGVGGGVRDAKLVEQYWNPSGSR